MDMFAQATWELFMSLAYLTRPYPANKEAEVPGGYPRSYLDNQRLCCDTEKFPFAFLAFY